MSHAVAPRFVADEAANTSPFSAVELVGRGTTFACDVPGPSPDAPVVVLLHGLFATGNLNWSPFFDDLSRHYRVVAIDHRGHGRGVVGDEPFTLEACADDIAALLTAIGIDRAILVGYSMGGPIAQLVWRRHPEHVRGLVLCATAGRFGLTPVDGLLLPVVERAGRALSRIPAPVRSLITVPALSLLMPDPALRADVAVALAAHDMPSIRAAVRSITRYSSLDWLGEITVPTAVLLTARDRVVPAWRQEQLVELVPDAEAFRIAADHLACFDNRDMFGDALLAACESVAVRSAPAVGRLRARWHRWRARRSRRFSRLGS